METSKDRKCQVYDHLKNQYDNSGNNPLNMFETPILPENTKKKASRKTKCKVFDKLKMEHDNSCDELEIFKKQQEETIKILNDLKQKNKLTENDKVKLKYTYNILKDIEEKINNISGKVIQAKDILYYDKY